MCLSLVLTIGVLQPLRLACYMYGKYVYIIAKGVQLRNVRIFSRESLPYTSLANAEITVPQVDSPRYDIFLTGDKQYLPFSLFSYGTHAIPRANVNQTTFKFWPASTTANTNGPLSSPRPLFITFDHTIAAGASVETPCLWRGLSSNYVLALFSGGDTYTLRLIYHDHQAQNVTSRVLNLPHFLTYQLDDVCSIGLDDHLGKVFLAMNGGTLCELSYI
jgi:hypothetical protein